MKILKALQKKKQFPSFEMLSQIFGEQGDLEKAGSLVSQMKNLKEPKMQNRKRKPEQIFALSFNFNLKEHLRSSNQAISPFPCLE